MSATLTWWGHAALTIDVDGVRLLIDPFLNDNPRSPIKASAAEADYILLTHGHSDHVGDAVAIARRTGAVVLANFEIVTWLATQGVPESQAVAMNTGGRAKLSVGTVQMTLAHHSSSLPDGAYGGMACGFLFDVDKRRIYVAGDTALFLDMKLIGVGGLDVAVLPIGDQFTMGVDDSLEAIKLLGARRVVPCHYDTWPPIEQNVEEWAKCVRQETAADPVTLVPGEPWRL